jgi:nitroreductase
MLNLDDAIKQRSSTRNFLPKPVPREHLDEALTLAQLAPSNSNIQPWHVTFVSGAARASPSTSPDESAREGRAFFRFAKVPAAPGSTPP